MKYVLTLFLAASIPIAVAICVLPTPLEPISSTFFFSSINLSVAKSKTSFLLILGWKSKSNSSKVLIKGNPATRILNSEALCSLNSISFWVRLRSASKKEILFLFISSKYVVKYVLFLSN